MKYNFIEITANSYYTDDPLFNDKEYRYFKDIKGNNTPSLFEVKKYNYVLIKPYDFMNDKRLCFKAATYLYYHKTSNDEGVPYIYFFGNISECIELRQSFSNYICKYISYEMLEEWEPKTLEEINSKLINFILEKQRFYGEEIELKNFDMRYLLFISPLLNEEEFKISQKFLWNQLNEKGCVKLKYHGDEVLSIVLTKTAIENFQVTNYKENSKVAFI